jgi:hypothetical protein
MHWMSLCSNLKNLLACIMISLERYNCTTEWKIVTYINLETVNENFKSVKNYAQMSADFCKKYKHKLWVNYTGFSNSIRETDRPIREVGS